jgi:hypothetical protein
MLPPGRAKLATMPAATGSSPIAKTIGIIEVAAFAASAETMPPVVAIKSTSRATVRNFVRGGAVQLIRPWQL